VTTHTLDLLGEVCPVPLLRTKAAVTALPAGQALAVETDFARAVRNITQWCSRQELPYELTEIRDGVWQIVIQK